MHAAIRITQTGHVLVGQHGECQALLWEIAAKRRLVATNPAGNAWLDEIEDGFVTTSGKFLNRESALNAALRSKQVNESDRSCIEEQNGGPGLELLAFEERCRRPGGRAYASSRRVI